MITKSVARSPSNRSPITQRGSLMSRGRKVTRGLSFWSHWPRAFSSAKDYLMRLSAIVWKPGHSWITTSSTERKYAQEGIPTKLLLRTFREACITTKNLGLRYLWIDSLCIIQQADDVDKARELLRMADYYQNADLNISAATEHNDGLSQKRDGEAIQPFIIPITINTPNLRRKTRRVVYKGSSMFKRAEVTSRQPRLDPSREDIC